MPRAARNRSTVGWVPTEAAAAGEDETAPAWRLMTAPREGEGYPVSVDTARCPRELSISHYGGDSLPSACRFAYLFSNFWQSPARALLLESL